MGFGGGKIWKKRLRMFGWEGLQAEGMNSLSMSEVRQMLRDVAWREAVLEGRSKKSLEVGRSTEIDSEGI